MITKQATISLPSDTELVITREFAAPRELLWEAWTTPEHMVHWYGPSVMTMTSCEIDLRPGGTFRWVTVAPDGSEHAFSGEYHEVDAPARVVCTERYEPVAGSAHLVTATFEETDGMTLLTSHLRYPSRQMRDGHIDAGMEPGMQETMRRLDEYLEKMR